MCASAHAFVTDSGQPRPGENVLTLLCGDVLTGVPRLFTGGMMTTPPEPTPTPPQTTEPWAPNTRDEWVDMMSDSFVKANEKLNPPPAPPAEIPPPGKATFHYLSHAQA